jgi:hypothetical protein
MTSTCNSFTQLSYLVSIRAEYEPYILVEACPGCGERAFSILKSSWKMEGTSSTKRLVY